jgi:L-asparaginase
MLLHLKENYEPAKIHLVTTGGTIEKTYDETDGLLENRDSIIVAWLHSHLRLPHTHLCVHGLMAKDSLFMTEEDRALIAETIRSLQDSDPGTGIVISHGTDTMALSALFCEKAIPDIRVPVLFTGAMKPLGFLDSDAVQNITEAIMAAQLLAPGFYIAFHNRIFTPERVVKNLKKKTFEAKE